MNLRRLAVDAGIAVALAVATAATSGWQLLAIMSIDVTEKIDGETLSGLWWAATGIGLASLLVRGSYPLATLAGSIVMNLVHLTLTIDWMPSLTPLLAAAPIAMYSVAAASTSRTMSYAALAVTVGALCLPKLLDYAPPLDTTLRGSWLLPSAAVAIAWLLGDHSRTRQAYLQQARQRADDLERERDQQAELAAATERARIARDLHDAVAHSLSVIVLQAHAGAAELDQPSHPTNTALMTIATTGRESLAEIRQLLAATRPGDAELAPLPGLAAVPGLVERIRAAHLPVRLTVTGDDTAQPASVQLSAYRIVREALTNTLRHAGPDATVDVTIHSGPGGVEVTVTDTGLGARNAPDPRLTNGMRGMRERAAALGGTLSAGNRPGGGFQVHACLPAKRDTGRPGAVPA